MNLSNLKTSLLGKSAKYAYKLKDASPTIMVVVGIGGLVAGTAMFVSKKPEYEMILDEIEIKKNKMNLASELAAEHAPEKYTDSIRTTDAVLMYRDAAFAVVKTYAVPVIVIGASVAAIIGSHRIMQKRNIVLVGAYKTLEASYNRYRKNVVNEYGPEQDKRMAHDHVVEQYTTTEVDKKGNEKEVVKDIEKVELDEESTYARMFDSSNPNWDHNNPMANFLFVRQAEHYLRLQLYQNGFLFLNQVYKTLGLKQTPAGQVVGWTVGFDDTSEFELGMSFAAGQDLPSPLHEGNRHGIFMDIQPEGMIVDKI